MVGLALCVHIPGRIAVERWLGHRTQEGGVDSREAVQGDGGVPGYSMGMKKVLFTFVSLRGFGYEVCTVTKKNGADSY